MVIGGLGPVILLPVAALTGLLPSQLEALSRTNWFTSAATTIW